MTDTATIGHNGIGGAAAEQIKQFVSRIERIEDEISERQMDRKEIYAEAKGQGFDVKILRKLIARRKRDRDELAEEESLLELYEGVFG